MPQDDEDEYRQFIDDKLAKAYYLFEDEKYTAGLILMNIQDEAWTEVMADCGDILDTYKELRDGYASALGEDSTVDMDANYSDNKAMINQQWSNGL